MSRLDAVVIAGDIPQEILGREIRESARLAIDGVPASLDFLREYFLAGKAPQLALRKLQEKGIPSVSLNGPYLCQFLERKGFSTALVPLFTRHRDRLLQALEQRPLAVVISTTFFPFAYQIDAIAAYVKEHGPDVTVIAGGIQVWKSYRHRALLREGAIADDMKDEACRDSYFLDPHRPSPVDVFVVSDAGEMTLARLLVCLRDGEDYRKLDNAAYFENGSWRINAVKPEPYAEVRVDWSRFRGMLSRTYVPVQAGVGCRFRCKFCDFRGLRPSRTRDPQSIVEELRTIPLMDGARRVYFTDDNMFASRKRAKELCKAFVDADLSLQWKGLLRISSVDEEIAELMARSGCFEACLGIESGDPGVLQRMGKKITPERILAGLNILDEHGVNTQSYFIIGFPGETVGTIQNTIELLNAYPTLGPAVHRYITYLFAVAPLSAAASPEFRAQHNLRGYLTDWSHSTMCAEEARRHMREIPQRVKPEISLAYHLEQPDMPGLSVDQLKRIYCLRNRIYRAQKGLLAGESEDTLWQELEACFAGAAADDAGEQLTPREDLAHH